MTRLVRILAAAFALIITCSYISSLADGVAPYDQSNPQILTADHLYAKSALLVDERTGEELLSKNARVRMFPASTTKIMTLLLALESDIPLDAQVTIPAQAADIPEGSSVIPVKPGDVTSFEDLLYGFMLSSGNDGANAIAILTDGSIEAFVARMNRRARELGLEDTHFTTCSGLYDDGEHYSSAWDIAVMSRELLKHPFIKDYTTIWLDSIRDGAFELNNTNKLVYWYPGCTGLKTGYTSTALFCLAASAEREGTEYIAVVLRCETPEQRSQDAKTLLNYAFANYRLCPLRPSEPLREMPVDMGRQGSVGLRVDSPEHVLAPKSGEEPACMNSAGRTAGSQSSPAGSVSVISSLMRLPICSGLLT